MTKKWLSTREAAEYLGLSVQSMWDYRCAGIGPRSYKTGRYVRYDIDDLDTWVMGETA